jgi:hypothetical protein
MSIASLGFRGFALAALLAATTAGVALGQAQRDEQFYYPGRFNWEFLGSYPEAARLFNAFDYGHAVLYERLYTKKGRAGEALEKEYHYLTTDLLIRPPRLAIVEEAVMPEYAKVAWRAKMMFDWAHLLHRQVYDVYADDRLAPAERDSLIERLTDYYLSNGKYAFTDKPKSMALMDEQSFSQTFRKAHPKFNGLIWAYHWLQVGLYEPFIEGRTEAEKKAGVQVTSGRFWSMLEDPPNRFPKNMPMTSAIAPRFSAAHPRAAVIFDNLHMMHDIISDILTTPAIPTNEKGRVINEQLDKLQDSTRDVMSMEEWRMMADHMGGVEVMGGPATGLLREVHAVSGKPQAAGHTGHDMPGQAADSGQKTHDMESMDSGKTDMPAHDMAGMESDSMTQMNRMMELHRRMMQDSVIRDRMLADTTTRRLMRELEGSMPQKSDEPSGARDTTPPRPEGAVPKRTPEHEGHAMPGVQPH